MYERRRALWALYNVGLAGITDIQLLENASRAGDKTYVRILDKCVQSDLKLGFMGINRWIQTKEVQSLMPANVFADWPIDTWHYGGDVLSLLIGDLLWCGY
jgi:exonuclease 3'-5' domain-containing protein 1